MAVRLGEELYYMTHHENLASILERGILCHSRVVRDCVQRVDISDPGVQQWRERCEPVFGRPIHDYVPLYFNPRNPMLSRRRQLQNALVILVISNRALDCKDSVLFADGNAACKATRFSASACILSGSAPVLQADNWHDIPDGKRRRCAEALVHQHLRPQLITSVVCSNAALAGLLHARLGVQAVVDASLFF